MQASITCEVKWFRWVWGKCKRKAKYTIYKAKALSPPQIKLYGWQTPIPHRKSANREESRGLVKMSANCLSVSMYLISISPFSTWSLRKWCLLSTCLIFLWKTVFLATEMALVLSHMREILLKFTPKYFMMCTIQRICEQQLAAATYSASVVDCATEDCFREDQQSKGSRVRRSPSHRPVQLQLASDATSVMVPRAPPVVAPSPVFRLDWETLAKLASMPSKLLDLDACPVPTSLRRFWGATDKPKPT
jgi:hypothetical protein